MRFARLAVATLLLMATIGCDVTFNMHEPSTATVAPPVVSSPPTATTETSASSPEPRPAWVDEPPRLHGSDYKLKVIVGPEATRAECEAKLGPAVEQAAREYLARTFPDVPEEIFDLRYATLKKRVGVVGEKWEENLDASSGEATFLHVQLQFDGWMLEQWQQTADRWTRTTRTYYVLRVWAVGVAAVLVVHLALRFGGRRKDKA